MVNVLQFIFDITSPVNKYFSGVNKACLCVTIECPIMQKPHLFKRCFFPGSLRLFEKAEYPFTVAFSAGFARRNERQHIARRRVDW